MDFGRTYTKMPKTTQKSSAVLTRGYFPGLFAAVLALAGLARAAGNPAEKTLVFFGDSLTAGYGLADPAAEAYPALIQARIRAAGLPWRVVNAGLSGETTAGGLRRIDWTLRTPPDLFVLALGANDGLRGISPALMRSNLEEIIERVRRRQPAARIVLAGMQMPPELGPEHAAAFGRVFPEVAKKTGVTLIPFLLEGVGGVAELNQGDRIHPNPAGHAIMADTVWKIIRPLL
jgi:acyl-CoA thioesterase-1